MDFQDWPSMLLEQIKNTHPLEWIAVAFGIAQVLLARVNNILLYPAGIIATVISAVLLFEVHLYAESALNIYYLVMSIYGWIFWAKKKGLLPQPISYTTRKEWLVTAIIVFPGWLILYFILDNFTPSDVPAWDSWVSSTAWAGMWLLARRKIENWLLLNVSNFFAVPLLIHKNLFLFAGLTVFLFIVAVFGYFDWKRIYRRQTDTLSAQL